MFEINFKMANGSSKSTTKDTIAEAQSLAREIMNSWDHVEVVYAKCHQLVIFQAICGIIIKEYK